MISPEFDFSEFIDAVKNRDKHIIFSMAESEAKDAEKNAEIKGHGQDYVEALMGFIYFLRYQVLGNIIISCILYTSLNLPDYILNLCSTNLF